MSIHVLHTVAFKYVIYFPRHRVTWSKDHRAGWRKTSTYVAMLYCNASLSPFTSPHPHLLDFWSDFFPNPVSAQWIPPSLCPASSSFWVPHFPWWPPFWNGKLSQTGNHKIFHWLFMILKKKFKVPSTNIRMCTTTSPVALVLTLSLSSALHAEYIPSESLTHQDIEHPPLLLLPELLLVRPFG